MIKKSVLFVCLGNICRSPTAHAVFQSMVNKIGLSNEIYVDGAGTGDWHLGHAPDRRSAATAALRGYDMSALRSRLVTIEDFTEFDYIIAMDADNLCNLRNMCPPGAKAKLQLLLDYSRKPEYDVVSEVPDPYYGGEDGFPHVLDLIEDASVALLDHIKAEIVVASESQA
jgi:protein-tyrosine phosphatase